MSMYACASVQCFAGQIFELTLQGVVMVMMMTMIQAAASTIFFIIIFLAVCLSNQVAGKVNGNICALGFRNQ